jgi:hypothetical protein
VFLCGSILHRYSQRVYLRKHTTQIQPECFFTEAYYTDTASVFTWGSILHRYSQSVSLRMHTMTLSSILHRYSHRVSLRKHNMTLNHVPYRFRYVCFIAPRINMAAYNPKSIIPHLYSRQEASLDHCPISYFDYIPGWQQSFITRSLQTVNTKLKTHLTTSTLHSSCS